MSTRAQELSMTPALHFPHARDPGWPVAVGDVVIHRFPMREGRPGKRRPCLVLAVHPRAEGAPHLTLAYGTDAERRANRGWEISVRRPADFAAAGLRKPTRFICARRATVSAADPGFDLGPDGTPVVGRLPGILIERLAGLLPMIDLDRDQPGGLRPRRRSRTADRARSDRPLGSPQNAAKPRLALPGAESRAG
jgi:hypothetical protein